MAAQLIDGKALAQQIRERIAKDVVDLVAFVVITAALMVGGWLLVGPSSQARATEARYPVALLPALDAAVAARGPDARIFNEYTWGG